MKRLLAALALAAASAGPAAAELTLEGVHWQAASAGKARFRSWGDIVQLEDGPPRLDSRLRARLTLKNTGGAPVEGILLRYSMTARISSGSGKSEGAWSIPFMVDERRVPKVGPNQFVDVPLSTSPALELYLNRLSRTGWWPDRVKLQVMIEPHAGTMSIQSLESVLEVHR